MLTIGNVCELVPNYTDKYNIIRICGTIGDHYEFETGASYTERCHINSLMAHSFKVIASNVPSLDEFKVTNPEYFV